MNLVFGNNFLWVLAAVSLLRLDAVGAFRSSPASPVSPLVSSQPVLPTTTPRTNPFHHKIHQKGSTTQLEALPAPLMALAASPIGAVTVLASIVVVHEAGHYLAARSFNISVEEFSVGFGPKLLGFEALGNEFNLRALPLGGYVRFPENYDPKALEDLQSKAREAFMKRREEEKWTFREDALNIATFGIWDDRRRRKRNEEKAAQLEEENAKRPWWKKVLVGGGGRKVAASTEDPEDFEFSYYDDPNLLQNRPWAERAVVLSGGVIFNLILAFLLYFGEINLGGGIPQPVFDSGVVISQTPRPDGAAAGILKQGDIIVGVNGRPLVLGGISSISSSNPSGGSSAPAATKKAAGPMAAQKQVSDLIGIIRETPSGDSLSLMVQRDGKELSVSVKPKQSGATQTIGVLLGPNFKEVKKLQSSNLVQAVQMAYEYLAEVYTQTLNSLLSLLGMVVMGKGPPPGQSVSGPIGLIKSGTEVVSTKDLTNVVMFAAALSVNLGVVNALPLPALDGGQLVFVLAEALTGRKVNQRFQESVTSIAILLLLFLTVSTAFSDVGSIISGR